MKINLSPYSETLSTGGLKTVLQAHELILSRKHQFTGESDADIIISHACLDRNKETDIQWTHGLYPTGDFPWGESFDECNQKILNGVAQAIHTVAVSKWGARILERYSGVKPLVIHNGIFYDEYTKSGKKKGYLLWPKNSVNLTCDPTDVQWLSEEMPNRQFASFAKLAGMHFIGEVSRSDMKKVFSETSIVLGTTKENDSLFIMEAMASGIPVVAYNYGMTRDRLKHLEGCYIVEPGDIEGLRKGIEYLTENWEIQSQQARVFAGWFSWDTQIPKIEKLLDDTLKIKNTPQTFSIVIPCYNYARYLRTAVESAKAQTVPCEVIVVNDGSTDDTDDVAKNISGIKYIKQENKGVSAARNAGIEAASGTHIICLDADDILKPDYIRTVQKEFTSRQTAISMTPIDLIDSQGTPVGTKWFTARPSRFGQEAGHNTVPSCCAFSKEWWRRAGKYDPLIFGTEDANLWLKMMLLNGKAIMASFESMMMYRMHPEGISNTHRPKWDIFKENNKVHDFTDSDTTIILMSEDESELFLAKWRIWQLLPKVNIIGIGEPAPTKGNRYLVPIQSEYSELQKKVEECTTQQYLFLPKSFL